MESGYHKKHIETLQHDKIARLEGLYIEKLFEKTFLNKFEGPVSDSWWIELSDNTWFFTKHIIRELAEFDLQLAKIFRANGYEVRYVKRNHQRDLVFTWSQNGDSLETVMKRLEKANILRTRRSEPPSIKFPEKDSVRLEKLLKAFKGINLDMESIVESRVFANWYGSKRMWDIDFMIGYQNSFVALEVKQKYSAKNKTYGLNRGSLKVLNKLKGCGLEVFKLILEKPATDKKLSTVDQLTDSARWLGHRITEESFNSELKTSPKETSFAMNRRLEYYEEPVENFDHIAVFGKEETDNLIKWIDKKLNPRE